MISEKQNDKVVELLTPPLLLQRRAPGLGVSSVRFEPEGAAELVRLASQPPSQEAVRQMIQNIAGFFSQVAAWDEQQAPERKAA